MREGLKYQVQRIRQRRESRLKEKHWLDKEVEEAEPRNLPEKT